MEHGTLLAKWRKAAATLIALVNLGVELLFLGTLVYALIGAVVTLPEYLQQRAVLESGEGLGLVGGIGYAMMKVVLWLPVVIYVGIFVLPFVLTLPLSAPIIVLWRKPLRFLILRPFNRGQLSRPVKRIVARRCSDLGHTYTLSDADIKVPWYVRIPIVVGQLALFSFRMRKVRTPRQVRSLIRALDRTWIRNINWCLSWSKIFPIASADATWQACVQGLLRETDVVLIDVTNLSDNITWEIKLCQQLQLEKRMLYLVSEEQASDIPAKLGTVMGESPKTDSIFAYDAQGLREPEAFRRALSEQVENLRAQCGSDKAAGVDRLSIAGTASFVLGSLPLLALAFPNFGPFPRWNPWEHGGTWPGLMAVLNIEAIAVMVVGLITLALLALASRRNHAALFLVVIQALLLAAAPIGMLDW